MISKSEILVLHEIITSDEDSSVLNESLLDSAISAAEASFSGKDFFPSPVQKIARVAYGIIKNHPFVDGNKRTGIMFLIISFGREKISCKFSHEELINFGQHVADGTLSQEDFILSVMKSCEEAAAKEDYFEDRKDLERWQRQIDSDLEKFGRIGGKLYEELDEAGLYLDADNRVKSKLAKEAIIDRNSKPRRTLKSFEDYCEYPEDVCVIPGAGGDLQEWEDGICKVCNIKDRPEFNTFTGDTFNNKFGLKGNLAYPADYVFLAFPVDDITRKLVQGTMPALGAKWLKDLIG